MSADYCNRVAQLKQLIHERAAITFAFYTKPTSEENQEVNNESADFEAKIRAVDEEIAVLAVTIQMETQDVAAVADSALRAQQHAAKKAAGAVPFSY